MTIEKLSSTAQEGLRVWAIDVLGDGLVFEANGGDPYFWAWTCFLLRESEDRPEWFTKGKFAVIQIIEEELYREARDTLRNYARAPW